MNPLLFLLLLLSPSLFAATDTIRGPGDPQFKKSIDLTTAFSDTAFKWKNIGWAENNIVFAKCSLPDKCIRIYDFSKLYSPITLSSICPVYGEPVFFKLIKDLQWIYFTENNTMRIFDVSDLNHPKSGYIGGAFLTSIYDFTIYKYDTIFIYTLDAKGPIWTWYWLYTDHTKVASLVNQIGNSYMGAGFLAAVTGRYLEIQNDRLRMWKMPVTARPADASVRVGMTGTGYEFTVTETHAFASEAGPNLYVYDISDPAQITVIDTLSGAGTTCLITCKNLLLAYNGVLRIFDISDINAINLSAIFTGSVRDCKMDTLNNYAYCLESNRQKINILDLSKYVHQGTTNSAYKSRVVAANATYPIISVSSKSGNTSIRYSTGIENKTANFCIYNLNGRMVQSKILPTSKNPSTFFMGSSLPCGIYLLRFSSGQAVRTVKFVARNY